MNYNIVIDNYIIYIKILDVLSIHEQLGDGDEHDEYGDAVTRSGKLNDEHGRWVWRIERNGRK